MKITFTDVYWRSFDDETALLREFCDLDLIGRIKDIIYDSNSGRLDIHGDDNNFACHVYSFNHIKIGLERTSLLFATPVGKVGEITIFPSGKVIVVIEKLNAPRWAVNKQINFVD